MGAIWAYRVNGGPFGGRNLDVVYPGGKRFDPLGLADDPDVAAEVKVREIRIGCLAMFFMFRYCVQAAIISQAPVENWATHIVDLFCGERVDS